MGAYWEQLQNYWQTLNNQLNDYLAKWLFSSGSRLNFYNSLQLLVNNQVRLNEALNVLYRVYSDDGKRPSHPVALVIHSCVEEMNNGVAFTDVLSQWIPAEEGMLLQAGESAGELNEAFADAERIMVAKKKIIGSVAGAVAYPAVLFTLTGFLLNLVASDLVPKLAQIVDPKAWTGAAAMLYHIAEFVDNYGLLTAGLLIVLVITMLSSMSWLGGGLRIWLDTIPPWSIYRMLYGAIFLLNVSALIKSGMRLNLALFKLAEQANPWLRERINATLDELSIGKNLGEALCDTGYHFPDKTANRFLAVIAAYSGVDKAMVKFGNSWLEETIAYIDRAAKVVLAVGVLAVGVTMLLVIAGAGGLQEAMQSAFSQ